MHHRYDLEVDRLRDLMATLDYRCVDKQCALTALYVATGMDGEVVQCCAEHRPDDFTWWRAVPRTDYIDQPADSLAALELWSERACRALMDWARKVHHAMLKRSEAQA